MKTFRWLLLALLIFLGKQVQAQTACPPGMEEYGAGVCGYSRPDETTQQQAAAQQIPQAPPARWASRWGAIATDEPRGILGSATGLSDKEEAQKSAIADCKAKGGSPCKFEIAYDNECVSLVAGTKDYSINTGAMADAANQLAIKTCSSGGDTKCHVYYSACSMPVRIQ